MIQSDSNLQKKMLPVPPALPSHPSQHSLSKAVAFTKTTKTQAIFASGVLLPAPCCTESQVLVQSDFSFRREKADEDQEPGHRAEGTGIAETGRVAEALLLCVLACPR